MAPGLNELAAGTQFFEQFVKSNFLIVRAILQAKDDLKSVPEKTKDLIRQVELAGGLLKEVDPTYSWDVSTASPIRIVTASPVQIDRPLLESVPEELQSTLIEVESEIRKYELDDKEREWKSKTLEVFKSVSRQQGSATMQKNNVEQSSANLQKKLEELLNVLGVRTYKNSVETRDHVCEMHNCLVEIPKAMESVNSILKQVELEVRSIGEKVVGVQEHVNPATPAPAEIENGMVCKLIDAADLDSDNDSCLVTVESQKGPEEAWVNLEGELAGGAGDATEGNGRRASEAAGYAVPDKGSLRFTMSVNENRFFHVLTYAHLPGAKLKLYYPTKSDMKHEIKQKDSKVFFPNRNFFKRGPRRFELGKEGSSRKSTESIFLVFSRNTLVKAHTQDRGKNLEIANVAEELEEHLKYKLCEEVVCYDEIVVKHFLVDIFAKE